MEQEEKTISLPEIIIFGMLVVSAYLLGLFADFSAAVPVIGQALVIGDWIYSGFVLVLVQGWLIIKGGIGFSKQATMFAGNLIELIPFLNMIPIDILTFFLAVYLINHPKIAQVVNLKTGKLATNQPSVPEAEANPAAES